jgi:hypothetical protein
MMLLTYAAIAVIALSLYIALAILLGRACALADTDPTHPIPAP